MKYLKLHILLWYTFVILWTLWEMFIILIMYILYFIWNFKVPNNVWEKTHDYYSSFYRDKTILQTLKRRFNIIK